MPAEAPTAGTIYERKAREAEAQREWPRAAWLNLSAATSFEKDGKWERAEACWRGASVAAERRADFCSRRSDSLEGELHGADPKHKT